MSAAPVLTCRDLEKRYGGVRVIDGVTLGFHAGAITALVGPNGAGKTTIFHLIAGNAKADAGVIALRGSRIDRLPSWRIARQGIGRLFQDVRVFNDMTVLDNVLVALPGQAGETPLSVLADGSRMRAEQPALTVRAHALLALVDLAEHSQRFARELSYGQQKLLALSRLLATGADVLLLDEPAAGLSPRLRAKLVPLLRSLADDGKTVALIEHDLTAVRQLADVVLFMDEGRILSSGPPHVVLDNPTLRATYMGLE